MSALAAASRLERLLRPESIAVAGGRWASQVIAQCRGIGFDGSLHAIHPHRSRLDGVPCVASVVDLPAVPDAVFVGVRHESAIELVGALAARGAGGVVCFAAGFAESAAEDSDGPERQRALLAAAGDMPVIGPNCYGLLNYLDGVALWPDQHGGRRVASGVAIVTQSSNIAINLTMQRRGLPIGYMLTAGNQAAVSLMELAAAVIEDPRVTVLGLHVEGFRDVRELERLAVRARSLGKTIVVLATGRTDESRRALMSHSASLAGAAAATEACLERLCLVRVASIESFVETLKLLHVHGRPQGRRLLSLSCSGGEAALIADAASESGFAWPMLDERRMTALRTLLGPSVALANPLDYQTSIWHDAEALKHVFAAAVGSDDAYDVAALLLDVPRADRCDAGDWVRVAEVFTGATRDWPGCRVVIATLPESMPEVLADWLIAHGVVPFAGLGTALEALHAAALSDRPQDGTPVWLPSPVESRSIPCRHDEFAAKQWLQRWGVPVPKGRRLQALDASDAGWYEVDSGLQYPLVVKTLGLDHKSDVGGVRLGITDRAALAGVLEDLARPSGCLVEEQQREDLVELLVSVVRDPVHGLLMTLGAGGIETELLDDTVHTLLPLDTNAWSLLARLRLAPRLRGFRGRPGVDRVALEALVSAVERAALALGDELIELELNPVLCGVNSAVAVDALLTTRSATLPLDALDRHGDRPRTDDRISC